jgi:hypothetical protein
LIDFLETRALPVKRIHPRSKTIAKTARIPVVMRIGPAKTPVAATRQRLRMKNLRPSAHGLILGGSTPLLTLALYIGWQMASPAADPLTPLAVTPSLRPAAVVAAASDEPPASPDFAENQNTFEVTPTFGQPPAPSIQQVPYEEPVVPQSHESYADGEGERWQGHSVAKPYADDSGRAIRVQSVVPVYSEPPVNHPSMQTRMASKPGRAPIPMSPTDDEIYRR